MIIPSALLKKIPSFMKEIKAKNLEKNPSKEERE